MPGAGGPGELSGSATPLPKGRNVKTPRVDLWEPSIPSDGLTVDTPLGPVDLVAVDRARAGHPVELNEAELTWLALKLGYVPYPRDVTAIDARRLVARNEMREDEIDLRIARHAALLDVVSSLLSQAVPSASMRLRFTP